MRACKVLNKVCEGYIYHLFIECIRKGTFLERNYILKGKGLDLGVEHPRINFC